MRWTSALLTPHDVFWCDCRNYNEYTAEFSLCAVCDCLSVCACGSGEHENREQSFCVH